MGAIAKKGAVALMRRTMKELKSATKKHEAALVEWRAVRRQMHEYKRFVRTKRTLETSRDKFGELWQQLPKEVQIELAPEFWPGLNNVNAAFDHNGHPIRIGHQNIRPRI